VVGNNEPTDTKMYGAGKDAATTGNAMGSGDTLGNVHSLLLQVSSSGLIKIIITFKSKG